MFYHYVRVRVHVVVVITLDHITLIKKIDIIGNLFTIIFNVYIFNISSFFHVIISFNG